MMRVPIGKFFATSEFCSRDSCASENCWNRGIDFKKVMAEPPIAELSVAAPKGSCFGTRTRLPVVFESRFEPEKSREDPSAPATASACQLSAPGYHYTFPFEMCLFFVRCATNHQVDHPT